MPHSQELFNDLYPEPNQPYSRIDIYFFKVHSNITLPSRLKGLFPVRLPVKFLKALLPSSILAT